MLAACSEKPQRTLAPLPELSLSSPASTCGVTGDGDFDGDDPVYLLNRGARRAATAQLDSVKKSLRQTLPGPDTAGARVHAFQLIDILIHAYRVDSIAGGQTAATRTATTSVINSVLCYVGLPTSFTVDALGSGRGGGHRLADVGADDDRDRHALGGHAGADGVGVAAGAGDRRAPAGHAGPAADAARPVPHLL